MNTKQDIDLISVATGWGAQIRDTEMGPLAFEQFSWEMPGLRGGEFFRDQWTAHLYPEESASDLETPYPVGSQHVYDLNLDMCHMVAETVSACISLGGFPITIGGDHLLSVGSWSGAIGHLNAQEQFGLIWIDAHMDSHTPKTTPSQAYHGMPLAILLGQGDENFINLYEDGTKLSPAHVSLIGIRSYEPEEQKLLESLGVRIYYIDEVKKRGFEAIIKESIERATTGTKGFGVSIDLDAFDPEFAPGVGSPAPNGLIPSDVIPALKILRNNEKFIGMDLLELNYDRDQDDKTLNLMMDILRSVVG